MPTLNLGSTPVTQDISIDEGRPFNISFRNTSGNFPQGSCAVMRIRYTADDLGLPSSIDDRAGEFIYNTGRTIRRIPKKNLVYNGAVRTIELKTTRPGSIVADSLGAFSYITFVNYSLLSMAGDTITLSYPQTMTTAKQKTIPSQPGGNVNTWFSMIEWYIENFDIFSMPYKTAKYELYIITTDDTIAVCTGNINKNALTIPGSSLPNCL